MSPACSVVIPSMAPGLFLDEAVRSVLSEGLDEIEVIVVWDAEVEPPTQEWQSDARVNVVHMGAHVGTPAALNAGVRAAGSALIARLDSDDVSLPGRLSRQVDFLQSHQEHSLVAARTYLIDPRGEQQGLGTSMHGLDVRDLLLSRNVVTHSSVMYRRIDVETVGGYSLKCNRMQDYHLFLRLGQLGKIAILPDRMIKYRVHAGQSSRRPERFLTHTNEVLVERMRLARHLDRSLWAQAGRNMTWFTGQFLRYSGLRSLRFDVGATR